MASARKPEAQEADVVALSLLKQLQQDEEGHVQAKAGRHSSVSSVGSTDARTLSAVVHCELSFSSKYQFAEEWSFADLELTLERMTFPVRRLRHRKIRSLLARWSQPWFLSPDLPVLRGVQCVVIFRRHHLHICKHTSNAVAVTP